MNRSVDTKIERDNLRKSCGICEECGSLFMLQEKQIDQFIETDKDPEDTFKFLCLPCELREKIRIYNQDQS